MNNLNQKIHRYFIKNLTLLTVIFIISSCGGQINSENISQTKKMEAKEIGNPSKTDIETTDSKSLIEKPRQKDSVIYNQLKNGNKDGLWREYDGNNQLIAEGNYKDGKANGIMKWFFEGELVAIGNMNNDKRDGLWKICDVHNKKNCIEASFKDDKKVGIWKVLHDNGKVWKEQNWENGKMISEKCWDANGIEMQCK